MESSDNDFSDKIPPSFDGSTSYSAYKEDVLLWINLTSLPKEKHGPALIGRLRDDARMASKGLDVAEACSEDGANRLLDHLDKSFGTDNMSQLDHDLSAFFDYHWDSSMTVDQFVIGFHNRYNRISVLDLDSNVRGHILLRQTALNTQEKNLIVNAAGGSCELPQITTALRNAFRDSTASPHHLTNNPRHSSQADTPPHPPHSSFRSARHTQSSDHQYKPVSNPPVLQPTNPSHTDDHSNHKPVFFTYSSSKPTESTRAMIDSGATNSVVGQSTLDAALQSLNLSNIPDATIRQKGHRFGPSSTSLPSKFAVLMPFVCTGDKLKQFGNRDKLEFDIHFDVVDGDLPFLIGLPTLVSMNASLNFISASLSIKLASMRYSFKLQHDNHHFYLPMEPTVIYAGKVRSRNEKQTSRLSYYCPSTTSLSPNTSTSPVKRYNQDSDIGPLASTFYTPETNILCHQPSEPGLSTNETNSSLPTTPLIPIASFPTTDPLNCSQNPELYSNIFRTSHPINQLSNDQLLKFHLQLQHGSFNQIKNYLRSANLWTESLAPQLRSVLDNFPCVLQEPPAPRPVISSNPPNLAHPGEVSVDIITLAGHFYLHVIDRLTRWSELGYLSSKRLEVQIAVFMSIFLFRHGPPLSIRGDEEYKKPLFLSFCHSIGAEFISVAANHHEGNGMIERGNRTIRMYFDRIRLAHKKETVHHSVERATYAKNICRSQDSVSFFERLYGRTPHVFKDLPAFTENLNRSGIANESSPLESRRRVQASLKSHIRCPEPPTVGQSVFFWRDGKKWLGPATVVKVNKCNAILNHNGRSNTADFSRIINAPKVESGVRFDSIPEIISDELTPTLHHPE